MLKLPVGQKLIGRADVLYRIALELRVSDDSLARVLEVRSVGTVPIPNRTSSLSARIERPATILGLS